MLHKILVAASAALFFFAMLVGVVQPLAWHPYKLLTDADYARQHRQPGVTLRRRSLPFRSPDAGMRTAAVPPPSGRRPAPTAADLVVVNARWLLWSVGAASLASLLLFVDGLLCRCRRR